MELIAQVRTESEVYKVYRSEKSVIVMTYTLDDGNYEHHQSSVDIDADKVETVTQAMLRAIGK